MKENLLIFSLAVGVIIITWFVRGYVDEKDFSNRIATAPSDVKRYEVKKEVPLPVLPMKPRKPGIVYVTDNAAIKRVIDSLNLLHQDSLVIMYDLLTERHYEYGHPDSAFYMALTAVTPFPPIIDSMKIRPVKCDSIIITKLIPVKEERPWYLTPAYVISSFAIGWLVNDMAKN